MQVFVIDSFSFCQNHEQSEGQAKIADFPRLVSECAKRDAILKWSLRGGFNQLGLAQLSLSVTVQVQLVCQRCLTPFEFAIDSQSELILAKNDDHADEVERMLEDDEIDVVVGSKTFNIKELIEDEVLLAIPQSPKHAVCPDAVSALSGVAVAAIDDQASKKVSPFAVLKKLTDV